MSGMPDEPAGEIRRRVAIVDRAYRIAEQAAAAHVEKVDAVAAAQRRYEDALARITGGHGLLAIGPRTWPSS